MNIKIAILQTYFQGRLGTMSSKDCNKKIAEVIFGTLLKTKNMKYIIVLILGLFLFISCDKNEPRFICVCANLVDNYPKGAKHLDYSREITYVLKFRNGSKDSIFFPFYGIYGWGGYQICILY